MPKKVTILVGALMLLLASTQLALAQQDGGIHQTVREAQVTSPDPAQQDTGQDQPVGETQPAAPSLDGLMRLNENNNLVINCQAVSDRLAQLNQLGETQANDPQFQSELTQVQVLAQLCADSGFTPSTSAEQPSDATSTGTEQA